MPPSNRSFRPTKIFGCVYEQFRAPFKPVLSGQNYGYEMNKALCLETSPSLLILQFKHTLVKTGIYKELYINLLGKFCWQVESKISQG